MMTLNEIRKLRGMTLSEFSRKSGLSPHTARNLMGYRELYGNPRMDTMVDAVVMITPKGVTIRARKESA
jgi:lambda repressor-like predicted transcriptional regulator